MTEPGQSGKEQPTVTFGKSAAATIVEQFGWEFNDDGTLIDPERNVFVSSVSGERVSIEEFAGVVKIDGRPVPIRDDFAELCDYVEHSLPDDDGLRADGGVVGCRLCEPAPHDNCETYAKVYMRDPKTGAHVRVPICVDHYEAIEGVSEYV